MKKFLLIGLLIGFAVYPLVSEETTSACHATEKQIIRQIVKETGQAGRPTGDQVLTSGILNALSTGDMAAAYMKDRYPALPASIGCWIMWWKVLLDPSEVKALTQELGLRR